jgi:hypothetical protein
MNLKYEAASYAEYLLGEAAHEKFDISAFFDHTLRDEDLNEISDLLSNTTIVFNTKKEIDNG